ncbi:MAG: hypothetical protein M3227_02820 [Thermoproteota archaeon]|nr:hypothetical protein [Thermoproteota archaeon]
MKNCNHTVFFIDPIELKLPLSRKVPVGLRVLSFILRFFRLILAPIFESLRGVPPSFKEIILLDQELN